MSIRAYRVITKEVAYNPTFNLWHDEELIDFLKENGGYEEKLNEDGVGCVDISVEALKKALTDYKWEPEDYRPEAIREDIAFTEKEGNNWVEYECY